MHLRIRKLTMIYIILHLRDDIDRLYVSTKEDSVDASIRGIGDNIKKGKVRLITATRNRSDHIKINRTVISRKQKWEEKHLYGFFKRQTDEISREITWALLRMGNLKRENESLLIGNKNSTIRTSYVK